MRRSIAPSLREVRSRVSRRVAFGLSAGLMVVIAAAIATVAWNARGNAVSRSSLSGRIAFSVPPSDGNHLARPADLYVIDADGSNRRLLTRCPKLPPAQDYLDCIVRAFAWSPDGRQLAFVRGTIGGPTAPDLSLFVVDVDGQRERRLPGCGRPRWPSCGDFFGSQPAWAPDGSRLVVPRSGVLYVVNVDRWGYRRLMPPCRSRRCYDMHPAWAPDGATIVFRRMEAPRRRWLREFPLYSVNVDGSGLKKLTNLPGWTANPVWSADGRRIAFTVSDSRGRGESRMYSMAADGSDLTLLASGQRFGGPRLPAWSPDGTKIAYSATPVKHTKTGEGLAPEVWVINADGTGRTRLYQSHSGGLGLVGPIWSPGGTSIAFGVSLLDRDDSGIFVMKADGSGLQRIAEPPTEAAWQPQP
jgi:Tol biopolymer transport system component